LFDAVADITRMGDWSSECTGGRWIAPATGPAVGAKFEGDNVAQVGPLTLKRWTTTSVITEYAPDETFEFVAEDFTAWRYDFEEGDGATTVTESFRHEAYQGWEKLVYGILARRSNQMIKGMHQTLARIKETLES
jgi:hypothetical protein